MKPIPFVNLKAQYDAYKQEIDAAVQLVLDSSHFILGPEVTALEQELATFVGCDDVVTCGNGTDALLLAMMALDIQPGDEVITSVFSFIAAAEMIAFLRAKPVFVDIEEAAYNLDVTQLAEKITPKTKAIIPVNLYGQPCDMDEINQIAMEFSKKFGHPITVIEDAAQSLGAQYKNKKSGNLSQIACTSFFPAKPLGCYGDGGAVFANDQVLADKVRALANQGQTKRYSHPYVGMNSRLDAIQAAILRVKLKYFPDEIKKRQAVADAYNILFKDQSFNLPVIKTDRESTYAQYTVRTKDREAVKKDFLAKGIPTAIHYPIPLHLQPCFSHLGGQVGDFPIAEKAAKEVLSFPMCAFLNRDIINQ